MILSVRTLWTSYWLQQQLASSCQKLGKSDTSVASYRLVCSAGSEKDKLQQSLNQPERSTSAIKPRKKLNFKKAQQWTDVTAFSVARNATKHGRVRMSTARRVPTMWCTSRTARAATHLASRTG